MNVYMFWWLVCMCLWGISVLVFCIGCKIDDDTLMKVAQISVSTFLVLAILNLICWYLTL